MSDAPSQGGTLPPAGYLFVPETLMKGGEVENIQFHLVGEPDPNVATPKIVQIPERMDTEALMAAWREGFWAGLQEASSYAAPQ